MKSLLLTQGALALGLSLSACATTAPPPPAIRADAAPPTDVASAIVLAQLQRQRGDLDGATRTLGQLMLVAADDPRVLGEYGKTLIDKGQAADALAFLTRAVELQPGDWTLYSAAGVADAQRGDYAAAEAAFGRALLLKPDEPTVLNNQAMAVLQRGDLDGAERLLLRATTPSAPSSTRIAQNLALVRQMKELRPVARAEPAPAPVQIAKAAVPPGPSPAAAGPTQSRVVQAVVPAISPAPKPAPAAPVASAAPAPLVKVAPAPTVKSAPTGSGLAVVTSAAASPAAVPKPVVAPAAVPTKPEPPKVTTASTAKPKARYIQIAAYFTDSQAAQLAVKLSGLGAHVFRGTKDDKAVFRVRLGPFATLPEARDALARAQASGYADAMLVTEAAAPPDAPALRMSANAGVAAK